MKNKIIKILTQGGIDKNEAAVEAELIIENCSKLSKTQRLMGIELQNTEEMIKIAKTRANSRVPIQHILGEAWFMGEKFEVNEHTLIPRDETEILVNEAVDIIGDDSLKTVLDIGCGSGCITCMIAKKTNCEVLGVDISLEALKVSINNAQNLNLIRKALFRKSDVFSNVGEKFDVIVSNPPYIPYFMKENIQKEVSFEPENALFAEDNGLFFYKKIISQVKNHLNPLGSLFFECGQGQSDSIAKIMEENGFISIKIKKDLANIDRVVSCIMPC